MSLKLEQLRDQQTATVEQMQNLAGTAEAEAREMSPTEHELFKAQDEKAQRLTKQIDIEKSLLARMADIEQAQKTPLIDTIVPKAQPLRVEPTLTGPSGDLLPARVKRWANLTSFKGPNADIKAYKAGMFYLACFGNERAKGWLHDHGISMSAAAQAEGVNTAGGYLVYDELDNIIINLRDTFGVFARNARMVPMTSDVISRPRQTGGLTAYFVGEDTDITESNKTWDQVKLIAKKIGCITRITNELNEDAIINVADNLTKEMAYAFAKKLDQCGFIGTGAATYGGIVGVQQRLSNINGEDTGGGLIKSANNTYAEITLAELTQLIAILPEYAQERAKWYCSTAVWGQTLLLLTTAGGGNTIRDLEGGQTSRQFLGFPVELSQALPSTAANSQICILFGDLALAADLGDRRQITIKASDSATVDSVNVFQRDETALVGTMRGDINVHDVGDASTAGPMVGLILHSA